MAATHEQLRGYVEYLRDLGVYDLYRLGLPEAAIVPSAQPISPAGAPIAGLTGDRPLIAQIPAGERAPDKPFAIEPPPFVRRGPLPPNERAAALAALQAEIGDCTRCPLAYGGRRNIVFGNGDPSARLMFVGESPGADEDSTGEPFVGKAGQLLNNMIGAMGLRRDQVYVVDIVKCRPPNTRIPEPVEANTCSQFLVRQIDIVQPKVIVALGATAALYLLGVRQPFAALRGVWHECRGARLAVTYHPDLLLRDPRLKGEAWQDLQRVMTELGLEAPKRSS